MMNLGQFLTIKREAMKWSRQQIADSFGVSYNTIYQWETGKKPPHKKHIKGICKHYGFSMSELKAQFKDYDKDENIDISDKDIEKELAEIKQEIENGSIPTIKDTGKESNVPGCQSFPKHTGTSMKFTQHAFPLDQLKAMLDIACDTCENILGDEAHSAKLAYYHVLTWIAELEGNEQP